MERLAVPCRKRSNVLFLAAIFHESHRKKLAEETTKCLGLSSSAMKSYTTAMYVCLTQLRNDHGLRRCRWKGTGETSLNPYRSDPGAPWSSGYSV